MKEYVVKQIESLEDIAQLSIHKKAIEIVRCKCCKLRNTNACFCKSPNDVKDDSFCSEGERTDEEFDDFQG